MIILIGPDGTGKTTLAESLSEKGYQYHHYTKDSGYEAYIPDLFNLNLLDGVLDRHAMCEFAYASVMGRKFRFTMKQWHNLMLLTLIQNPVIVLCVHKPFEHEYPPDQYLPYAKWDICLGKYREFLNTNHIAHTEYDYSKQEGTQGIQSVLKMVDNSFRKSIEWWTPMWKAGYGCIGSTTPRVLLVAERIGPNNSNNIPFETGPTGYMLTDLLAESKTPLGIFAVTNMVKSFRRDPRPPTKHDQELLSIELEHLKPKVVVFMGRVAAQAGIPVAKDHGIEHDEMVHLGYYNHQMIKDVTKTPLLAQWKKIIGIV